MTSKQVRVSPGEDGWRVHQAGAKRDSVHAENKAEAVSAARTIAQNQGAEMIVQNENGHIGFRNSYGNDPYPPRG